MIDAYTNTNIYSRLTPELIRFVRQSWEEMQIGNVATWWYSWQNTDSGHLQVMAALR